MHFWLATCDHRRPITGPSDDGDFPDRQVMADGAAPGKTGSAAQIEDMEEPVPDCRRVDERSARRQRRSFRATVALNPDFAIERPSFHRPELGRKAPVFEGAEAKTNLALGAC